MAKAHQQYYADEVYIQKQAREFSPTEELLNLAGGEENVIEEIRVNGVQLIPDQDKAVDITVPLVVDALDSTSTADALSAKQGKVLYDYIQNISVRGRFLSNWNCATGLATTNPEESPYAYRAGDYFIVSNIAAVGGTNYRPSGASYVIGQASTDVETASVGVSDLYIYDGTNWILMSNGGGGSIAVDSSLSTTSTNPVENRVITNELNKKYYGVVSNAAPSNPTLGMIWYDTTSGNFKTYDGSGRVRKLDLGLNKVFDNSTVEIGKWAEEGGVQSSGHHVTIDPNGEVSTYNVTVAGHNEATLGSGTLELLSNTALGGDETLTISHEQIVANDGTNTQIYSFFGNDRIAKLSDIGGGYSAGAGIDITNNVISADTTVLATKTDLDEKQDELIAGSNITIGQVCESDMRGPAPSGFHIPTNTEWTGVRTMFSNLSLSYSTFSTHFHMPVMGIRGNSSGDTESGYTEYWSSVAASNSSEAYAFYLDSGNTAVLTEYRAKGFPIRAFKNSFEVPTSSWTVVTGTLGSAGIFRNQTDGLISITSDGTTGYTMMDKNIGATTVWSNGDAMSQANCGNFFQWGNNYGFAFSGLLTTSSAQIDTTGYGPGNYYSDSTYIVGNSNRSSIDNKNLWGGVTQQYSTCQSVISATDTTYTAGTGISIDANNEISNTLPGATVSSTAPSVPSEGTQWYDTTNDVLKVYDGANWNEIGGGTTYTAGTGIDITNDVISADTTTLATKSDLDEKQDELTAGDNITIEDVCNLNCQGPCPRGFHVPTTSELTTVFITIGNALGAVTSSDYREGIGTYYKVPAARFRDFTNGNMATSEPPRNYLWACTDRTDYAENFVFYNSDYRVARASETYGISIRPFKDTPVVPDNTRTTLLDGSSVATDAGIFWNEAEGLISLSSDGTTWYTIADKNLGATVVYNRGDVINEFNSGGYFQRGNNHMFPGYNSSETFTRTSTQVDASGYGPGNYYDSDVFICGSVWPAVDNWTSVRNQNLWGGTNPTGTWCIPNVISAINTDTTYAAGTGISIDANNEIANTLPGAIVSATAPSNPTEGMVWYDTTNDALKAYNGTSWETEGTKMVVLEYGVSTWQDFLDAYNKNALVYCKVSSGSSGYRMAFMAYTAGTTTPTEVEFQYYRSRSSHSTAANQLDEVYVYKLTNAGVWTTTQRDTAAKAIAGTGIGLSFNSSGMTISADTSVLATQMDLNSKANATDVNTKTFYLSGNLQSAESIAAAQAAYDWYLAGKNPLIYYGLKSYSLETVSSSNMFFYANSIGNEYIKEDWIMFDITGSSVDSISAGNYRIDSANTKTFTLPSSLTSQDAIDVAQDAYDWYLAGKTPIIRRVNDDNIYMCVGKNQSGLISPISYWLEFHNVRVADGTVELAQYHMPSSVVDDVIRFTYDNSTDEVTQVERIYIQESFLPTSSSTQVQYTPSHDWDPTTKEYVDDRDTYVSSSAPSSPTEGKLWYDTTNDVLKSYDGTNWNAVSGDESLGGPNVRVSSTSVSDMRGPCPLGFHVPLGSEWGSLFTIFSTFNIANTAASRTTYFKLPGAGHLGYSNGSLSSSGEGHYWESGWSGRGSHAMVFWFGGSLDPTTNLNESFSHGNSIRPFKDTPVVPDSSWTVLYDGSSMATGASVYDPGIYHNPTLGLISASQDGEVWITMADKNLGAIVVYNSGDTCTWANSGNFYQWGNNFGFPYLGATKTSSTLVDTSGYGPGNYYNNDTFVTMAYPGYKWFSPDNSNLWGGTTRSNRSGNVFSEEGQYSSLPILDSTSSPVANIGQMFYDIATDKVIVRTAAGWKTLKFE